MDVVLYDNKYILNPLHELTCHVGLLAGQQKSSYKKILRIQKEHYQLYNFCREADMLAGDIVCVLFILTL